MFFLYCIPHIKSENIKTKMYEMHTVHTDEIKMMRLSCTHYPFREKNSLFLSFFVRQITKFQSVFLRKKLFFENQIPNHLHYISPRNLTKT